MSHCSPLQRVARRSHTVHSHRSCEVPEGIPDSPLAPTYRNSRQLYRGVILFLGGGEVRPRQSSGPKGEPESFRGLGGWTMVGGTNGRGHSGVSQVPDSRCSRLITDLRVQLPCNSRSPDGDGLPWHKRGVLALVDRTRLAAGCQGRLKGVQVGRSSCPTSARLARGGGSRRNVWSRGTGW